MDLTEYANDTAILIDGIKELFPRTTSLEIAAGVSAYSGLFQTELRGHHERIGYTLTVNYEYLILQPDKSIRKKYRYRISRGAEELIRFQSDRNNNPENAHFPPHFLSEDGRHFEMPRWPSHLQDMSFPIVFKFFLDVVRADGDLPEPFRSARP